MTAASPLSCREQSRAIVARLQAQGHQAYWVGGCVRDQWLRREPTDYDVATSARPDQIEALFPHTLPVGRSFGVVLVVIDRIQHQVSTFRAEGPYLDGRHPSEVRFTHAVEDARRRDLTVNGLFYDPIRETLHDWVGGQADLEAGLIRTIGEPADRLGEDYLRLLRVPRFAAQLDFRIEPATLAAVRQLAPRIGRISAERVRDELKKTFRPPHAGRGLDLLRDTGLLVEVLPELVALADCEQSPEFHPEGTVYEHVRRMLELLPADAPESLAWAVLLHDIAKPLTMSRDPDTGALHFYGHDKLGAVKARELMTRLRFAGAEIEAVEAAVRHHMQFQHVPHMRRATRRSMILRETFPLELALHRLDCLGSHGCLVNFDLMQQEAAALAQQPELKPPLVTGHDLIALGLKPGPALGALLAELREQQLQETLRTRDEALDWVRQHRLPQARG